MSAILAGPPQLEVPAHHDLYRTIADLVQHMVWTCAADGTIDYVNAHTAAYTGVAAGELCAGAWKDVVHPDDVGACVERWNAALASGEPFESEYRLRRADGEFRWHRSVVQNLRDREGRVLKWFGTSTDIDEQRRAFNDSENRFRSFMDNLPASAWIKDASFRLTWVNRRDVRLRGRRPEDIIGRDDFELRPARIARMLRKHDEEVLRAGAPRQFVYSLPDLDGNVEHYVVVKFPLKDAEGKPGVAGIAVDITESHRLQYAVRELLQRRVQAQEEERRRVAGDLHDLVGQKLSALGILIGIVRGGLSGPPLENAAPRLEQMSKLVEETMTSMREVMAELRPPAFDDHGLAPALHQHAAAFEARTGMKVQVDAPEGALPLPPDACLALFRVAQEGLTNAAKHSGASRVDVRLEVDEDQVSLVVEDDGRGFPAEKAQERGSGWGLQTLRERAEAAGGQLLVESGPHGTRISATLRVEERRRRRRQDA